MSPSISPSGINLSPSLRFAFNGQEKTDEISGGGNHTTALYWEYDTRLGRRWNLDPMAHLRVEWTPYNALRCNPVRNVDPSGALDDDYSVDKSGKIKLEKKTNDITDKIHPKDDNGKIDMSKTVEVDKGILDKSHTSQSATYEPSNLFPEGGTITRDNYKMKNDSKSSALFEFLAENTEVEWVLTRFGSSTGENGLNMLTTTHKNGYVSPLTGWLMEQNYLIRGEDHNHPGGNPTPSGADKNNAYSLLLKYPKTVFRIYTAEDKKYTRYANYNKK